MQEPQAAATVELARIDADIASAREASAPLAALRTSAVSLTAELAELDDQIAGAADRIRWAEEAANVVSCPNCDCRLVLRDGELVPVDPSIADLAPSAEDLEQARTLHASATARRTAADAERTEVYAKIAAAIQAKTRLAALERERTALANEVRA